MKIKIYTTPSCPFCDMAKDLLNGKKLVYEEVDVSQGDQKEELVKKTGWRTVPQIFIDDVLIGGFQELAKLDQEGKF